MKPVIRKYCRAWCYILSNLSIRVALTSQLYLWIRQYFFWHHDWRWNVFEPWADGQDMAPQESDYCHTPCWVMFSLCLNQLHGTRPYHIYSSLLELGRSTLTVHPNPLRFEDFVLVILAVQEQVLEYMASQNVTRALVSWLFGARCPTDNPFKTVIRCYYSRRFLQERTERTSGREKMWKRNQDRKINWRMMKGNAQTFAKQSRHVL